MIKDVFVYSAIPPRSRGSIRRYGLLSGEKIANDQELLKKARPTKEARTAFVDNVKKKLASKRLADNFSVRGPSVFFTEVDEAKVTEDHFIKKWRLERVRINLTKLLAEMPDTIIYGVELVPYPNNAAEMSDEDFEAYLAQQGFKDFDAFRAAKQHPLTLAEVRAYTKRTPKSMWKHYSIEHHTGRYYAANVPHAFIITPTGQIPFKYIEFLND